MKTQRIPEEWFPRVGKRLAEVGLPVRFDLATLDQIEKLAIEHDVSMATIVRILVHHSLSEMAVKQAA